MRRPVVLPISGRSTRLIGPGTRMARSRSRNTPSTMRILTAARARGRLSCPWRNARAGISQDGFYLKQGVSYKLRLHMRGEGDAPVWASLHGGGQVIAGPVLLGRAG